MRRFPFLLFVATTFIGASTPGARADLFEQGGADPNLGGYTAVGYGTTGTFTISSDTTIPDGFTLYQTGSTFTTSSAAFLGFTDDTTGTINVTGSGAQWTTANYVYLGNNSGSTGIVNVENGGLWTAASYVCVADNTSTTGTVNIGSGSQMTVADQLYLGNYSGAVGTLNLTGSGAQLTTTGYAYLGYTSGATGIVNVENGGLWTVSSNVYVAYNTNATGTVTIESGSQMTVADQLYMGASSGAVGTLNLTGSGSQLTVSGNAYLGNNNGGTGNISVSSGAALTVTGLSTIGAVAGSTGSISVSDGGTFTSGDIYVGGNGAGGPSTGSLSVTSGGQVMVTGTSLGVNGALTVDGAGSKLMVHGAAGDGEIDLFGPNNSIQVTNGGEIDSGAVNLDGTTATVLNTSTISGTGSLWKAGTVLVGESGVAALIVADGGKLQATGSIGLGYDNTTETYSGTLQIGDGGAPGTISASEVIGGMGSDGSGVVVFDHNFTDYTFINDNGSGAGLKISGQTQVQVVSGTTSFIANDNDYTLGTQITGGKFMADNTSGSATGSGSVTVGAGGTLGGKGFIAPGAGQSVTIAGTLAPGDTAKGGTTGKLTFALGTGSNLTFQSGAVMTLNLVGGGVSDEVAFATTAAPGTEWITGANNLTLSLNLSGLDPYAQTYDIFDNAIAAGMTGQFTVAAITGYDTSHYQAALSQSGDNYVLSFTPTPESAPEPSTWLLLGLGLGTLVLFRRKAVLPRKR